MKFHRSIENLTFTEWSNDPLTNERVSFVLGGRSLMNVIHQEKDEEIVEIVHKMLDYDEEAAAKYYPEGYKLLEQMGEEKIIQELDSKEYIFWCVRE